MRTGWQLLKAQWGSKAIKEDRFNPTKDGTDLKSILDFSHNFSGLHFITSLN